MAITTMTRKGQVTIPKAVRDRMGLKPGNDVEIVVEADGRTTLSKVGSPAPRSRFEALRGRAGPGPSTDEIMALMRGEL